MLQIVSGVLMIGNILFEGDTPVDVPDKNKPIKDREPLIIAADLLGVPHIL